MHMIKVAFSQKVLMHLPFPQTKEPLYFPELEIEFFGSFPKNYMMNYGNYIRNRLNSGVMVHFSGDMIHYLAHH